MQTPWVVVNRAGYEAFGRAYDSLLAEHDAAMHVGKQLLEMVARKDALLEMADGVINDLMQNMEIGEEYAERLRGNLPWYGFDRRDWLRRWEGRRLFCFHCGKRERMAGGVLCEPCVNALEEYSVVAFQEDAQAGNL